MGANLYLTHEQKEALIDQICHDVVEIPIIEACKKANIHHSTFFRWITEEEKWSEKYARARAAVSYTVEPKLDSIVAKVETGELKPDQARVMIDAEKWLAGRRNAKVYGDKIDHTSGGKAMQGVSIVVANEKDKEALESI